MAITSAIVDMETPDNVTWNDAFRFGDEDDTSWSFTNQSFRMDVKQRKDDTDYVITMTSANGRIVVDDETLRVLHFNVPESVIQAFPEIPGWYVYDLIMYDTSNPAVRMALMNGRVKVCHGVTGG